MTFLLEYFQFNTHGLLYIASGALCFTLGLLVYFKDRHSQVNFAFFHLSVNILIWTGSFGMFNLMSDIDDVFLWTRIAYIYGITFIPISTLLLGLSLRKKSSAILAVGYVSATLTALPPILLARQLTTFEPFSWGRYPAWNTSMAGLICYWLIVGHFILFTPLAFQQFFKYWRGAATPHEKRQGRILFFGFFILYTATADFATAIHVHLYPYGFISLTVFCCIIFYTIVQHQLLDIKIALKKISLVIFVYTLLLLFIVPIAPLLANHLLSSGKSTSHVIIEVSIILGLMFSLGPFMYAYIIRNTYWLRGHQSTGLVHELKSPLSTIETATELLLENLQNDKPDREKALEYTTMIQNNAVRLQGFVQNLLILAREDTDEPKLREERFDLAELSKEVSEFYSSLAKSRNLTIRIETDKDVFVNADREKIEHVLSNLVSNAIKFSKEGTILISISGNSTSATCAVQDSGKGLSYDHLERVFEKFFQVDAGQKGTGIGLTIAKTWIEAHGGKIWAESKGEGYGSTFRFSIPI